MSIARLHERVPSAKRIGCYSLKEHDLRFHKYSKIDGSGKCDAYYTGNNSDVVLGSLFEIDHTEKPALDKAEGLGFGYEEKVVAVLGKTGKEVEATTYYATNIDDTVKPYSWYLNHVLLGARETGLPRKYIELIETIESIHDQNDFRDQKERARHS